MTDLHDRIRTSDRSTPRRRPVVRTTAALMFVIALATLSGCASQTFRERERIALRVTELDQHLGATSVAGAIAPLAPEFDSGDPITGEVGRDREALVDALEFAFLLHRRTTVRNLVTGDDTISASCVIEDDLMRLLDHPGTSARVTWHFDSKHRIDRTTSETPPSAPQLRNWLAPAIAWIRTHHAADLEWLLDGDRLRQDARTAVRWRELLTKWRAATGRPEVILEPLPFAVEPSSIGHTP